MRMGALRTIPVVFSVAAACVSLASAFAHHSFGVQFDATKPVALAGEVTSLDWVNPHVYLHMDVRDEDTGEIESWTIELGSPNALTRLGWRPETVRAGDVLEIQGSLGRYRDHLANATSATLARTGRRLSVLSTEAGP